MYMYMYLMHSHVAGLSEINWIELKEKWKVNFEIKLFIKQSILACHNITNKQVALFIILWNIMFKFTRSSKKTCKNQIASHYILFAYAFTLFLPHVKNLLLENVLPNHLCNCVCWSSFYFLTSKLKVNSE